MGLDINEPQSPRSLRSGSRLVKLVGKRLLYKLSWSSLRDGSDDLFCFLKPLSIPRPWRAAAFGGETRGQVSQINDLAILFLESPGAVPKSTTVHLRVQF